jgi:hypothetical protein
MHHAGQGKVEYSARSYIHSIVDLNFDAPAVFAGTQQRDGLKKTVRLLAVVDEPGDLPADFLDEIAPLDRATDYLPGPDWCVQIFILSLQDDPSAASRWIETANKKADSMREVDGIIILSESTAVDNIVKQLYLCIENNLSRTTPPAILFVSSKPQISSPDDESIYKYTDWRGLNSFLISGDDSVPVLRTGRYSIMAFFYYMVARRSFEVAEYESGPVWQDNNDQSNISRLIRALLNDTERHLPLLLLGDAGTGKEYLARRIHFIENLARLCRVKARSCEAAGDTWLLWSITDPVAGAGREASVGEDGSDHGAIAGQSPFLEYVLRSFVRVNGESDEQNSADMVDSLRTRNPFFMSIPDPVSGTLYVNDLDDLDRYQQNQLSQYCRDRYGLAGRVKTGQRRPNTRLILGCREVPEILRQQGRLRADLIPAIDGISFRLRSLAEWSADECYRLVDHCLQTLNTCIDKNGGDGFVRPPVRDRLVERCLQGTFKGNLPQLKYFIRRMILLAPESNTIGTDEFDLADGYSFAGLGELPVTGAKPELPKSPIVSEKDSDLSWRVFRGLPMEEKNSLVSEWKSEGGALKIDMSEIEKEIERHPAVSAASVVYDEKSDALNAYVSRKNSIEIWPSVAEFYVYDNVLYRTMASHDTRNSKYLAAFRQVLSGKTVVEIGPGPEAILSRLAIEAGARKVYAIELLDETYRKAREAVTRFGLEDRIIVIKGDATTVELPELADYCISEIVGSIGGAEGASVIVNRARRLLTDPSHMIPGRSLTKIAAVELPVKDFDFRVEPIAAHYTRKIFDQVGRPFDLRVCIKYFPNDRIITNDAAFEDLDYRSPISLESTHDICLEFDRPGVFTGLMVWLTLHINDEQVVDTLVDQKSWLPLYFPVSHEGEPVDRHDRLEMTITRRLSKNQLNPDFRMTGVLHRKGRPDVQIDYDSPHDNTVHRGNNFYRKLFDDWLNGSARVSGDKIVGQDALNEYLLNRLSPENMPKNIFIKDEMISM